MYKKFKKNMNEFEENNPKQLKEFLTKLYELIDDYHHEIYLLNGVVRGFHTIEAAIKDKLNNEKNQTRTTDY